MLALYEGQFGEQTQVWRLNEVYVRSKIPGMAGAGARRRAAAAAAPIDTDADTEVEKDWFLQMESDERSSSASPLNAGFAPNSSTFDKLVPLLAAKRSSPLSHLSPQAIAAAHNSGAMSTSAITASASTSTSTESITSAVVRMLESDDHATRDDYLVAMLGGLEGQEVVHEAEVHELIRRRQGEMDSDEEEPHSSAMNGSSGTAKGKRRAHSRDMKPGDDLELMLVGTVRPFLTVKCDCSLTCDE
ncbi:hypothetical protein QFC24_003388 [Naganishia onofrii]|uniref:Uncharacterized protein n=1 Tax=Naganishia onofrii TaxID=1851511 RepID=A0ACC2XLV9_9TREE|nr:hypothetical protein QFC24_003388 [Naganishia onofrii]